MRASIGVLSSNLLNFFSWLRNLGTSPLRAIQNAAAVTEIVVLVEACSTNNINVDLLSAKHQGVKTLKFCLTSFEQTTLKHPVWGPYYSKKKVDSNAKFLIIGFEEMWDILPGGIKY